jgi:hypothetical protein
MKVGLRGMWGNRTGCVGARLDVRGREVLRIGSWAGFRAEIPCAAAAMGASLRVRGPGVLYVGSLSHGSRSSLCSERCRGGRKRNVFSLLLLLLKDERRRTYYPTRSQGVASLFFSVPPCDRSRNPSFSSRGLRTCSRCACQATRSAWMGLGMNT